MLCFTEIHKMEILPVFSVLTPVSSLLSQPSHPSYLMLSRSRPGKPRHAFRHCLTPSLSILSMPPPWPSSCPLCRELSRIDPLILERWLLRSSATCTLSLTRRYPYLHIPVGLLGNDFFLCCNISLMMCRICPRTCPALFPD